MLEFILSLARRPVARSVAVFALACLAPFLLTQCGRSGREAALRADYRALQAEHAALLAGLESCREAAGLRDAALVRREREVAQITDKYETLRENFLRSLLPVEGLYDQTSRNPAEALAAQSFQDWCAQPLPPAVRGLLENPGAALALPGASGGSPAGN